MFFVTLTKKDLSIKNFVAIILTFMSFDFMAQTKDLVIIKRVDSLINASRDLTANRDFEKALELNGIAEELTLETLGKETATYGNVCFNKGRIFYFNSNYLEAEKWYSLSKLIRENTLGKEHADYAWSVNNLAILYYELGQFQKAELLYNEALLIREKVLGKEHPNYAATLNNLANLYVEMGQFDKAELLHLESLSIRKKVLGVEHPDYASSLYNLGRLYRLMGQYEKAVPLSIEEKLITERMLGKDHPDYAGTLLNLGILYVEMGKYIQAESYYLEAKTIQENSLGIKHPDYAWTLNNLAILYFNMSQFEKAEPLYLEAKEIRKEILGLEHPDYATSLDNLGRFYYNIGDFEKAEPLLLDAKAIRQKVLGKEHPNYATSLNNLAILYIDLGQFELAESLYLETKANWEKVLGKEHPNYADILSNLADLYVLAHNYNKAEHFMLEAKTIKEKLLGKEHPDYAMYLTNLGILYLKMGVYDKAEPLFNEAKAIQEKNLGILHPAYALTLSNLAIYYQKIGNYKKAEVLYLQALSIQKTRLGKDHPEYFNNLKNLANLYETQNRFSESETLLEAYFTLTNSNLSRSAAFLSERELTKYVKLNDEGSIVSAYLLSRVFKNQIIGKLAEINFNQALFQKGFLLSTTNSVKFLINSSDEAKQTNKLLKAYQTRLAREYSIPIADRDSSTVADLEEKANTAEKKLARTVAGYAVANRLHTWQDVQTALTKLHSDTMGVAAIEFVHFKLSFPRTTDSIFYAALLLYPGMKQVKFIPLFEEKELDNILKQGDHIILKANALYAARGVNPVFQRSNLSKNLYKLIWEPIESELKSIKSIYFSASGRLNQLNLGAIPIDAKNVLSDKYNLIQLSSTRQLIIPQQHDYTNRTAVLFGGIQYEMDSNAIKLAIANLKIDEAITSRGGLGFNLTDSTLRAGTWTYLPGTENEITALEKSLQSNSIKAETYRNYDATEEAFKQIGSRKSGSPRILHIATHGYFFADPDQTISSAGRMSHDSATSEGTAQAASLNSNLKFRVTEPVFKISDHPMLRSGLIMAGGNAAWQGKQTLEGREDGILTAYEISQMNLSNTELVVLSACETGLGDIQGNEGVYGLQRAFKIAGAKYLIMSLWQVPDKQTSMLMTTFYKKWLNAEGPDNGGKKMTIPDAFHAAQKELRELGLDPYQWAGFVLVE